MYKKHVHSRSRQDKIEESHNSGSGGYRLIRRPQSPFLGTRKRFELNQLNDFWHSPEEIPNTDHTPHLKDILK